MKGLLKGKNVLVCPLDWGLGHATRCVPIIHLFLESGANVVVAADNSPLSFLRKEFPELNYIRLPFSKITYPEKGEFIFFFIKKAFFLFHAVKKEKKLLKKYIDEHKIDIVISDNRLGLSSQKAYSILLSHHLHIKSNLGKFFDKFIFWIYKQYVRKFHECWIPDYEGAENLSGTLSHPVSLPIPFYYINPLSRFSYIPSDDTYCQEQIDVLGIISGPEPQRTQLQEILMSQLKKTGTKAIIVGGQPNETKKEYFQNIFYYSHLSTPQLLSCIQCSKIVISRSGYSTIMDLAFLGKPAVFIPTPNQTEQEYLADYLEKKGYFYYEEQDQFDLLKALSKSKEYTPPKLNEDFSVLRDRILFLSKHV